MIVVDSSVWIDWIRDVDTEATRKLASVRDVSDIAVGDIVLLEVLQGARSARQALGIEARLRQFAFVQMLDFQIARRAAEHFWILRELGLRIRATSDLVIGTYCIEGGHLLLHCDRDFDVMRRHLGLMTA